MTLSVTQDLDFPSDLISHSLTENTTTMFATDMGHHAGGLKATDPDGKVNVASLPLRISLP